MAKKFPDWHRPSLSERQLVGEENRLTPRGLSPEQVRADFVRVLAHHSGNSQAARCRDFAATAEISDSLVENMLSGRMPIYDSLLFGLYGVPPSGALDEDWAADPADWGPMLPDAIAAGLVETSGTRPDIVAVDPVEQIFESGADGVFLTVDPAPPAAAAEILPPDTAAALPVVAETTISAPELGDTPCAGDAATTGFSDLNSPRAPEPAGQDGEGTLREGSTIPAGQQGQPPVQLRDAAGEGDHSRPPPPPLETPPTNSFTRVLDDLHAMIDAAQEELNAAEDAHAAAFERVQLGRLAFDALVKAYNGVAAAHQAARELISKPPVTLADRRAA